MAALGCVAVSVVNASVFRVRFSINRSAPLCALDFPVLTAHRRRRIGTSPGEEPALRYGPAPENPLESYLLSSPRSPRAFFDTFVPIMQARAIGAAVEVGLFQALRDEPLDAAGLADATAVDPETLGLLLAVLASSDYLTVDADRRFALTEFVRGTLLEDSRDRFTAWVSLTELWWHQFAGLATTLRTGRGGDLHGEQHGDAVWRTYQAAMLEHARRVAPEIAALVPVREGGARLLDIGGSHGLFGALIARANPPMTSEVLELPAALAHARALATAEGLADVVTHRAGDALVDDLGTGYDVVFLGSVLHHFGRVQIVALMERIRSALTSRGTVAVYGMSRPDDDEDPDLLRDTFALFFRVVSSAACYTVAEQRQWLTSAGFVDLDEYAYPMGMTLLIGRTP